MLIEIVGCQKFHGAVRFSRIIVRQDPIPIMSVASIAQNQRIFQIMYRESFRFK